MVDSQNVNGLAVVCDTVAGAALGRVPARNSLVATNAREGGNVGLGVPSILGDEAICAIRARQSDQTTAAVIVTSVVRNFVSQ